MLTHTSHWTWVQERETPIKKRRRDISSDEHESWSDIVDETPPGFRNIDCNVNEEENEFISFIKAFITDLGLPSFLTQLIINFTIPFINKILKQITTSFMAKMAQHGSQ